MGSSEKRRSNNRLKRMRRRNQIKSNQKDVENKEIEINAREELFIVPGPLRLKTFSAGNYAAQITHG